MAFSEQGKRKGERFTSVGACINHERVMVKCVRCVRTSDKLGLGLGLVLRLGVCLTLLFVENSPFRRQTKGFG